MNKVDPLGVMEASSGWGSVANGFWGDSFDFNASNNGGSGNVSSAQARHDSLVQEAIALKGFNDAWDKEDYDGARRILADNPSVGFFEQTFDESVLVEVAVDDGSKDGAPRTFPFVHTLIAESFLAAIEEINTTQPARVTFTELFRSHEHQKKLHNDAQASKANWNRNGRKGPKPLPACNPDTSTCAHMTGLAFDVSDATRTAPVIAIFQKWGFVYYGKRDRVHFEWSGWESKEMQSGRRDLQDRAQGDYVRKVFLH